MTAFSTDTRSSMDACPPLEDIAAFLDGMLSPEDRERITAHLAYCESCYEVFAGAVHFHEYEDSTLDADKEAAMVSPFAGETDRTGVSLPPVAVSEEVRPRAPRWLAMAASLLLVPALGFFAWRELVAPPRIVLADVVEPFQGDPRAPALLYMGEVNRGQDEEIASEHASFMAGVHLVDLRLAIDAKNLDGTRNLLQDLFSSLEEIPFCTDLAESYKEEYLQTGTPADLDRLAPEILAKEAIVQEALSAYETFSFGLWTEAGRLAASTQSPEFFDNRNNRRFLSHLFKQTPWEGDELLEEVPKDLQAIQEIWKGGRFTREDYSALAGHFKSVIDAYNTPDEL